MKILPSALLKSWMVPPKVWLYYYLILPFLLRMVETRRLALVKRLLFIPLKIELKTLILHQYNEDLICVIYRLFFNLGNPILSLIVK